MDKASNNDDQSPSEQYRLQGNDAFATKDWKRAVELYQRSVSASPNAKAYSNLATALCKLNKHKEALKASERATALDPKWAKGWWRRGTVAEMNKFFGEAAKFYSRAVDLEKENKAFQRALKDIMKRFHMKRDGKGGFIVEPRRGKASEDAINNFPPMKAWQVFCEESAVHSDCFYETHAHWCTIQTKFPSSIQFFAYGLHTWARAMREAVASVCISVNAAARQEFGELQMRMVQEQIDQREFICRAERLFGAPPNYGQPLAELTSGYAHLGGKVWMETGGGQGRHELCPRPQWLRNMPAHQNLGILNTIACLHSELTSEQMLGPSMRDSDAVYEAMRTLFTNLHSPQQTKKPDKKFSPAEIVKYIKQQLKRGKTWDNCLRKYVSLQYRGNILFAAMMKMNGIVAEAFKYEMWAEDFICLAGKEFKVAEEESYDEKGSAFRRTLRIGFMESLLATMHGLRQRRKLDGPYPIIDAMEFCQKICKFADKIVCSPTSPSFQDRYNAAQYDVAWRRKPIALANSTLASYLTEILEVAGPEGVSKYTEAFDYDAGGMPLHDPFALIANHYGQAAEAELFDDENCALYHWGHAANMVQALLESGFTVGDLRLAVSKAIQAERDRDVSIFGENAQKGGTFETISRVAANYFSNLADTDNLPQVLMTTVDGKTKRTGLILVETEEIICNNFDEALKLDCTLLSQRSDNGLSAMMDTSEIEKKHGADVDNLIPSLQTLAVRELHKQGCEFAAGESDPAEIHYKSLLYFAEHSK